MNSKVAVAIGLAAVFLTAFAVPSQIQPAFAATVNVSIVPNSSTLGDQAFSPNPVEIAVGDSIVFTNDDTALHTATSGNGATGEADGVFDSAFLGPKKTATVTINQEGEFPYFCQLHPTMVGTVVVTAAGGNGGNGGNGGTGGAATVTAELDGNTYEVTSNGSATATAVAITPSESVSVTFQGSGDVELTLPTSMISGVSSVMAGDQEIEFTEVSSNDTSTTISFAAPENGTVDIMGATVVPEFGVIAALILALSIVAIVSVARVKGSGLGFFGKV